MHRKYAGEDTIPAFAVAHMRSVNVGPAAAGRCQLPAPRALSAALAHGRRQLLSMYLWWPSSVT
jgi:hypothetical protein